MSLDQIYEGPAGAAPGERQGPSAREVLQNMRRQNHHIDDALYYAKKHGPYSGKDQGHIAHASDIYRASGIDYDRLSKGAKVYSGSKDGMDYEIFEDSEGKRFSFLKTPKGMIHVTGHRTWQQDRKDNVQK
tara:strand:+ start:49 stop:441 length:393 start_codon:yes stop_codon:yes gene_type:complete